MEEEKELKMKKSKNIIIVLLVLIICLLIAYLAYDKFLPKQEPKEKEEKQVTEKKTVEKQLTENDAREYISTINKVLVRFDTIPMKTNELDTNGILLFAYLEADEKTTQGLSKVLENTFGKDYSYHLGDIQCPVGDGILYSYNQAEGTFSFYGSHPHGGFGGNRPRVYFVEGKELDDTITIKTKVLYGEGCGDICGPASYFYDKVSYKVGEEIYKADENHFDDYDFVYNEVKDRLPITTAIFKKQSDGRFGLTEITVE